MEIDNHILSLSMEFEKQNIIVNEWETEKAKTKSDRIYERRKKKRTKKKNPKIYLEPHFGDDDKDNEDNESGFEVILQIEYYSHLPISNYLGTCNAHIAKSFQGYRVIKSFHLY